MALFARETKLDDSKIRRLYSLSLLHRLDQTCVQLRTYRYRRGGGQYCYEDSSGRLVEERIFGRPFGRRDLLEIVLDSMDE